METNETPIYREPRFTADISFLPKPAENRGFTVLNSYHGALQYLYDQQIIKISMINDSKKGLKKWKKSNSIF